MLVLANLFLFHKLRIGAVIDDIFSKNRSGQGAVNFFGIDVLELSVQYEFVAFSADIDCSLSTE